MVVNAVKYCYEELLIVDSNMVLEQNSNNIDHHFIAAMPTTDKSTEGEMTVTTGLGGQ